jgi:hypothetical protein
MLMCYIKQQNVAFKKEEIHYRWKIIIKMKMGGDQKK